MPHRKLDNGNGNSVPKKNYVWANQSNFDNKIYEQIDADYFYELVDKYISDKKFNKEREIGDGPRWEITLQFYPNGRVRRYGSKYSNPNPEITGNRGIIYKIDNKIKLDIMEGVSNNIITINTYKVKISGDTLYILESSYAPMCFVFKKSDKIPDSYKVYNAEW